MRTAKATKCPQKRSARCPAGIYGSNRVPFQSVSRPKSVMFRPLPGISISSSTGTKSLSGGRGGELGGVRRDFAEFGRVEFALPTADDQRSDAVADDIGEGAAFAHEFFDPHQ